MRLRNTIERNWPLITIVLIACIMRLYNLNFPLNTLGSPYPLGYNGVDEGIHLMAARLASNGFKMYVDVNAQQSPLFMFIYQILDANPFYVRLMTVAISILGVIGVIVIGKRMGGMATATLAGLFLVTNYIFLKESRHASVDLYASVLLVIGFLFLLRYYQVQENEDEQELPIKPRFYMVLSGLFFALSVQSKLFTIIPFGFAGLYVLFDLGSRFRKKEQVGDFLKDILALGLTALGVGLAIMFIYGFQETLQGVLLDNLHRPSMPLDQKLTVISRFLLASSIPMFFSFFAVKKGYRERNVHLLLVWIVPTLLMFLFQGLTWLHYFVMVIPPIAVLGAYGISELIKDAKMIKAGRGGQIKVIWEDEPAPRDKKGKRKKSDLKVIWDDNPGSKDLKRPLPLPKPTGKNIAVLCVTILFILASLSLCSVLLIYTEEPIEYTIASDVEELSNKGDYVICGDPIIAVYADRDHPPEAANVAKVRHPELTSDELIEITCEYDVQVVVFSFHLSSYDQFYSFIDQYYTFHKAYDRNGETQKRIGNIPEDQTYFVVFYKPTGLDLARSASTFLNDE